MKLSHFMTLQKEMVRIIDLSSSHATYEFNSLITDDNMLFTVE